MDKWLRGTLTLIKLVESRWKDGELGRSDKIFKYNVKAH